MSEPSPALERWFTYHAPSDDEPQRYEAIRVIATRNRDGATGMLGEWDD